MFFILLFFLNGLQLAAQPGQLDTTFNAGTGVSGIKKMDVAPNGKIIVAGSFTEYNGVTRKGLAQINTDGTLDTTFDPGNLASALVETWALEYTADNKIMLSGLFFNPPFGGAALARVLPNGLLDATFSVTLPPQSNVRALALQDDGNILVGGSFVFVSGSKSYTNLARLTPSGAVDATFSNKAAPNAIVRAIAIADDASVWIGGDFLEVQGATRAKLARLTPSGELDPLFSPVVWPDSVTVLKVGAQRVVAANSHELRVYQVNGAPYPSFSVVELSWDSDVGIQEDGKLVVGSYSLGRFNTDGSLDETYGSGSGPDLQILSVRGIEDGQVIVAGSFTTIGGQSAPGLARLTGENQSDIAPQITNEPTDQDLRVGEELQLSVIATGFPLAYQWYKNEAAIAGADASTMRVGSVQYSDESNYHVVISNSVGIATSRVAGITVTGDPVAIVDMTPGAVLVETQNIALSVAVNGSEPLSYEWRRNGQPIAGANQSTFGVTNLSLSDSGDYSVVVSNPWSSETSNVATVTVTAAPSNPGNLNIHPTNPFVVDGVTIERVTLLEDGRYLVEGREEVSTGVFAPYVGRIESNGALDPSFSASFEPVVFSSAFVQSFLPSGELLVSVNRRYPDYSPYFDLYMLSPNGGRLSSFTIPGGVEGGIQSVVAQSDGKIIVCGSFESIGGLARTNIARLNADGTPDSSFSAPHNALAHQFTLNVLTDDRLYFSEYGSSSSGGLLVSRLAANGTRDSTFSPTYEGLFAPGARVVNLQPDGRLLVGGRFSKVNGQSQTNLVMLNANGTTDTSFNAGAHHGINGGIDLIHRQNDGKFLIGGQFNTVNEVPRVMIARLSSTGELDSNFFLTLLPQEDFGSIATLTPMADGDLLIGGNFPTINGFQTDGGAVLHGAAATTPIVELLIHQAFFNENNRFELQLGGRPGKSYRLQRSDVLPNWTDLYNFTAGADAQTYEDPSSRNVGNNTYRVIPQP